MLAAERLRRAVRVQRPRPRPPQGRARRAAPPCRGRGRRGHLQHRCVRSARRRGRQRPSRPPRRRPPPLRAGPHGDADAAPARPCASSPSADWSRRRASPTLLDAMAPARRPRSDADDRRRRPRARRARGADRAARPRRSRHAARTHHPRRAARAVPRRRCRGRPVGRRPPTATATACPTWCSRRWPADARSSPATSPRSRAPSRTRSTACWSAPDDAAALAGAIRGVAADPHPPRRARRRRPPHRRAALRARPLQPPVLRAARRRVRARHRRRHPRMTADPASPRRRPSWPARHRRLRAQGLPADLASCSSPARSGGSSSSACRCGSYVLQAGRTRRRTTRWSTASAAVPTYLPDTTSLSGTGAAALARATTCRRSGPSLVHAARRHPLGLARAVAAATAQAVRARKGWRPAQRST